MMSKLKLYIATSIDGYIADSKGGLDWLTTHLNPQGLDYGYQLFYNSIGSLLMGGKTYRDILSMNIPWPYSGKNSYIVSRNEIKTTERNIHSVTTSIIATIIQLKKESASDIWLVGGGKLIALCLENQLIDSMIITCIPKLLGEGVPLFPKTTIESDWSVGEVNYYPNGVVTINYIKK